MENQRITGRSFLPFQILENCFCTEIEPKSGMKRSGIKGYNAGWVKMRKVNVKVLCVLKVILNQGLGYIMR